MTASTEEPTSATMTTAASTISNRLPLRMISTVVRGFKRGSTELGIPTANLDRESGKFAGGSFDDLPTGIYWGFCRIHDEVYKTACSIGYNPTYNNELKTVEPHLIAPEDDERRRASSCGETILGDFYGQPIRLSLVGFLRPELPFEGVEKLIAAIKNDIVDSDRLGDGTDDLTLREKAWVASDEDLS
eukprot:scaffold3151_cov110-Cylindrotheca_fusiformis.AAC.7